MASIIPVIFFLQILVSTHDDQSSAGPLNIEQKRYADILEVSFNSMNDQGWSVAVKLRSPDTGCERYADWWEILDEKGELIYRRILAHSHVREQPFTRSGGPVKIQPDQIVWIRAHMNDVGYGGQVLKGSQKSGFVSDTMPKRFALDLANEPPLPAGCRF
jgi:hypothetical protein